MSFRYKNPFRNYGELHRTSTLSSLVKIDAHKRVNYSDKKAPAHSEPLTMCVGVHGDTAVVLDSCGQRRAAYNFSGFGNMRGIAMQYDCAVVYRVKHYSKKYVR
jgi:hypothetical protein